MDLPTPTHRSGARSIRSESRSVAIIGAGPAGLTAALLLARAGHRVTIHERESCIGGLWAARLGPDGSYQSENSCKVYQASYHTAPALFRLLGTRWEDHFLPRHDLSRDWLRPFVKDSSALDLGQFVLSFVLYASGLRSYRDVSVGDWLSAHHISEPSQAWMRATALGGITGTLRMTMWELFHRLGTNFRSILDGRGGTLYWSAAPPNAPGGFLSIWQQELSRHGVVIHTDSPVESLSEQGQGLRLSLQNGHICEAEAVFLAMPPRALSRLLGACSPGVVAGFGRDPSALHALLRDSLYEHLGIVWTFDRPLPLDLPLGGHNVRRGWHPILVQYDQYRPHLPPPAVTAVVGSVSLDTELRHPRLGTRARDHSPEELAAILWEDERRIHPALPEPIGFSIHGLSDATQIVHHGPLPLQAKGLPLYVATNLSGAAAYFTASFESAVQAGAAAALAFDPGVERLPVGPSSGNAEPVPAYDSH